MKKSLSILCGIGGLLHFLNYFLEDLTIRDESVMWISMAVPSLLGGSYLIIKMRLLRNKSYRKVKGLKRGLTKTAFCMAVLVASVLMFGGYLNFFVLAPNFLVTSGEKVETFNVIKIKSKRPGLQKRTSKRVPLVRFSDGKITDEVELGYVSAEGFNKDISKIEIVSMEGLWGLAVIKTVEVY